MTYIPYAFQREMMNEGYQYRPEVFRLPCPHHPIHMGNIVMKARNTETNEIQLYTIEEIITQQDIIISNLNLYRVIDEISGFEGEYVHLNLFENPPLIYDIYASRHDLQGPISFYQRSEPNMYTDTVLFPAKVYHQLRAAFPIAFESKIKLKNQYLIL